MIMGFPLTRLVIDGLVIPAEMIAMDGIEHDVSETTVTVTFQNVRVLETVYKHMED